MATSLRVRQRRTRRPLACPHLGLASDPLARDSLPSAEHRCYFQMQRERIDLAHQQDFCLSGGYRGCPWLAAAPLPVKERPWAGALDRARLGVASAADALLEPLDACVALATRYARASGLRSRMQALLAWAVPRVRPLAVRAGRWTLAALRWIGRKVELGARWAAPRVSEVVRALVRRSPRLAALVRTMLARLGGWSRGAARGLWVKLARAGRTLAFAMVGWFGELWRRPRLVTKAATAADGSLYPSVSAPSEPLPEPDVPSGDLIGRGVAALETDREDLAYELFGRACRRTPRDARAWFWLAKTAPSLDEVIAALEQAARLAPANEQVRVNLEWARARRERERAARALEEPRAALPRQPRSAGRGAALFRALATVTTGAAGLLASLACLVVGVFWIGGALPEQAVAYLDSDADGVLRLMPNLDLDALGGLVSLALGPVLNIDAGGGWPVLSALPYVLGFLALVAAAGLASREGWARWWAPLVAIASLALWLYASDVGLPPPMLVGIVTLTALAPLSPART